MTQIDVIGIKLLENTRSPMLDQFAVTLTNIGAPLVLSFLAAVASFLLLNVGRRRDALLVSIGVLGGGCLNVVLKHLFRRQRPDFWSVIQEASYSFPSGHAAVSAAFAAVIIIIFWNTPWRRMALLVGVVGAVAIGLTRVYLGVHYPTDVLAGWVVGASWVVVVQWMIKRFNIQKQGKVEND